MHKRPLPYLLLHVESFAATLQYCTMQLYDRKRLPCCIYFASGIPQPSVEWIWDWKGLMRDNIYHVRTRGSDWRRYQYNQYLWVTYCARLEGNRDDQSWRVIATSYDDLFCWYGRGQSWITTAENHVHTRSLIRWKQSYITRGRTQRSIN